MNELEAIIEKFLSLKKSYDKDTTTLKQVNGEYCQELEELNDKHKKDNKRMGELAEKIKSTALECISKKIETEKDPIKQTGYINNKNEIEDLFRESTDVNGWCEKFKTFGLL